MWCFSVCVHCEMIATMKLMNSYKQRVERLLPGARRWEKMRGCLSKGTKFQLSYWYLISQSLDHSSRLPSWISEWPCNRAAHKNLEIINSSSCSPSPPPFPSPSASLSFFFTHNHSAFNSSSNSMFSRHSLWLSLSFYLRLMFIIPLILGQLELNTVLRLWFDFRESQRDDYVIFPGHRISAGALKYIRLVISK